jgi:nitrate/TMAO reductase-like tetraheme cytochrome c subunit
MAFALALLVIVVVVNHDRAIAQKTDAQPSEAWVDEIEQVFIRSENCKQCHDRHYEEWKGMREQTPDLKTFGRVDAALLHGTSFESPVFRTALGLWMQTNPTLAQRTQCLSCHAPAVTVFPQHTERIVADVLAGKPSVEGIGCASCHLINGHEANPNGAPTYKLQPGNMFFGPFSDPEENLVHSASRSEIFRGANFCASCHFDKVKDATRKDLPGEILQGTICQDCHMEPSTGSSTSKRGAMSRSIGRHWFRGVVVAGTMLKNRNLQAEWMPRVDIDVVESGRTMAGTVVLRVGSLPHSFPDGDPVLKQFYVTIKVKDAVGRTIATTQQHFGLPYEQIMRGPIPEPLVKGGVTRRIPFSATLAEGDRPSTIEALLTYSLLPEPNLTLLSKYLTTLPTDKDREAAKTLLGHYTEQRLLTFRTKSLGRAVEP